MRGLSPQGPLWLWSPHPRTGQNEFQTPSAAKDTQDGHCMKRPFRAHLGPRWPGGVRAEPPTRACPVLGDLSTVLLPHPSAGDDDTGETGTHPGCESDMGRNWAPGSGQAQPCPTGLRQPCRDIQWTQPVLPLPCPGLKARSPKVNWCPLPISLWPAPSGVLCPGSWPGRLPSHHLLRPHAALLCAPTS